MTVAELIEALRAMPPDADVIVPGYEDGATAALAPRVVLADCDIGDRVGNGFAALFGEYVPRGKWEPSERVVHRKAVYLAGLSHNPF